MTRKQVVCLLLVLIALPACAPVLTPEGARVKAISKELSEGCERLGVVEVAAPWKALPGGPDGPAPIIRARNKVATLGGDAMVIYFHERPVKQGRGFQYLTRAEALNCRL